MAKDSPEYQRRMTITPAASPTGAGNAMADVGQSYEILGGLASQVASNAANQRSQLAGQKAGQIPGKNILPAITQADQSYRDAYVQESSKVLAVEADRLMNKLTFEFGKNPQPTGSDLLKFQEEATKGLSSLTNLADESIRSDLNRSFFQKFDHDSLVLAKRVEEANGEKLIANFNNTSQANLVNMYNFGQQGMYEALEDTYQNQLKNAESVRNLIGEDKYIQQLQTAKLSRDTAIYEGEMVREYNANGELNAIKYIQNFAKNKPEEINESEHLQILKSVDHRFSEMRQVNHRNNAIEYSDALLEMQNSPDGTLPLDRLNYYEDVLTQESFNNLQMQQLKSEQKAYSISKITDFMLKSAKDKNTMALKSLSKDQLDAGFAHILKDFEIKKGQPLTLGEEARIAKVFDVAIPSFNKKINDSITSKNGAMAAEAAGIYGALSLQSPNTVEKVTTSNGQRADTLNRLTTLGTPIIEAIDIANGRYDNLSPAAIKEREDFFKNFELKDNKLDKLDKRKSEICDSLGFREEIVPPGMISDFMEVLQHKYVKSGIFTDAYESTVKQISSVYKQTTINGIEQVMFMPPDRDVPTHIVKDLISTRLNTLFTASNQEFNIAENQQGLFKYNIVKTELPKVSPTRIGSIGALSDESYVERVDSNGNKQRGFVVIMSDKFTPYPLPGQLPSYSIWFQAEGSPQLSPVYDSERDYSLARFSVSPIELQKIEKDKKIKDAVEAQQIDSWIKHYQETRRKIMEMRLDEGEDIYDNR